MKRIGFLVIMCFAFPLAALDFTALDFTSFGFTGVAYQNSTYSLPNQNNDPYKIKSIGASMAQYSGSLIGGYVNFSFFMPYYSKIVDDPYTGSWQPDMSFSGDLLLAPAAQYKSGPLQFLVAGGFHGNFLIWEKQYICSYGVGGEARIVVSVAKWLNFNSGIAGSVDSAAFGSQLLDDSSFKNATHVNIFSGIGFNF